MSHKDINKLKISVIVCTHNGASNINECLNALKEQDFSRSNYEVIVVNDGSADSTKLLLKSYEDRFLIINNKRNSGLAQSRNIGFFASRAEIVAFTDDDCVPSLDWLKNIDLAFKTDNKIIGVSGVVKNFESKNIIQKYIEETHPLSALPLNLSFSKNPFYRLKLYLKNQLKDCQSDQKISKISSVVGANMAFLRKILVDIGGFDASFTFGSEEEELSYRLLKKYQDTGSYLALFPNIKVKHKFDKSFLKSMKRNFMYGIGNARFKRKSPERSLTILPFPILLLVVSILYVLFLPQFDFIIFFFPFIFYFGWPYKLIKSKKIELLVFPYIQFLFESSYDLGWMKGYFYG